MAIKRIDEKKCIGCRKCVSGCPADVIRIDETNGKAYPKYPEDCVVCGICLSDCPKNAIEMSAEPATTYFTCWG